MSAPEIKTLLRNLASVGLIQGGGYVLPLLTLPYLLSVLGAEGFGILGIAQAVTSFYVVLVDYGYNLIGTREVAVHRQDPEALNRLFSEITTSKLVLWLLGAIIFIPVALLVPEYRLHAPLFFVSYGITLGTVLLPVWLFQGLEKFQLLHGINTGYRLLYTLLVFALVHNPDDLLLVAGLNSGTAVLGGVAGMLLVRRYRLRLRLSSRATVRNSLKTGSSIFVSGLGVNAVSYAPLIVLGSFASPTVTGYFAFIDKITLFFRLVIRMLGSVTFPAISRGFASDIRATRALLGNILRWGTLVFLLSALFLFLSAEPIGALLEAGPPVELVHMLKWIALIPVLYLYRNLSELTVLALYLNKAYTWITLGTAAFHVLTLWLFTAAWGYNGTFASIYLAEALLVFASLYVLRLKFRQ